ncbi:hypothetical protein Pint_11272 [Pistacia integerrima]|uniref:Uncharacterized protein n=1 Tax=Pistacia integerrima TaxID=434235 RepID=A0ACC0XJA4_9ROSI|nr:hypothetical protein Pint_11272 [Pistacia integerrima]
MPHENNDLVAEWHFHGYVRQRWHTRVPIVALIPPQSLVGHGATNDVHIQVEDPLAVADESPEKEPLLHDHRALTETLLTIAAQGGLALFAARVSNTGDYNSSNYTRNGMILFCSAVGCSVIGFMCCFYAMLLHGRKPGVARILTATGCVATVYGFLAVMGTVLLEHLTLVIIGIACVASLPAVAVFMKSARFFGA